MKGVALVGKKGGIGKTSLSHLLAIGAAWKGVPCYFMHTDDREPINVNGRPYAYYDARKPDVLEILINNSLNNDGLFILDSGGNRPEFDAWIARSMDLVLIPVAPDPEDVKEALVHMEELEGYGAENVRFVVNKYPSNRHERLYVTRYLAQLPQEKIIAALPEMKAVRVLREDDNPSFETPPSKVNNLARSFYFRINHALEEIEQGREPEAVVVAAA